MNRALLKQDAKDAMKAANPHPVLTTLVFWAIQLAAQIILGIVSSICGFTTYFSAAISSGMYEDSAFLNYAPSIGAFLIYLVVAIVIGLLIGTVQFGYYAYSLKVFKHEEAGLFIVRDFVTYCYTGSQTYFTPKGKDVIRMKFQKKCGEELLPKMAR